jgi:hypothetical protein
MKVSDLIAILQEANPDFDVKIVVGYDLITIDEVELNDGSNNVLIGNDIPAELHGLDYKYEDY